MLFAEALELLKQGKHIVREGWVDAEGYLALMPGMLHIWKILPYPNPNAGNHILSVNELAADDWKEFSLPAEQEAQQDAA